LVQPGTDDALLDKARQYFAPLPKTMATAQQPLTPALVELGRALFFDPRMSVDGTASCARCHQPALYGISIDSRESFTMTRDVRCLR